jgi:hypothetical protein
MSLWDALRMNMMISYQELVRTFPSQPGRQAERKVIEAALQRFSPGVEGKTSCDRTGDQYCHVIPKDKTIRFIKPFFLPP